MPAVTAPSNIALPRITTLDPSHATLRAGRSITTSPRGFEGEGFPVRRAFAGVAQADLDPFIHLDQMGEVEYAPGEPKGTSWHPHRGFETVTYMIDGTFEHRDSNGGGGVITNGDTQWMTAGAGILHIEKPPEWLVTSGGLFHGLQLWVNLPSRDKMVASRYQDIRANQVALLSSADGGSLLRVIAGEVDGLRGPAPSMIFAPVVWAAARPSESLATRARNRRTAAGAARRSKCANSADRRGHWLRGGVCDRRGNREHVSRRPRHRAGIATAAQ